jgi:hypothetical protein
LTEATIPSTSHYKVYYHIYAGKDIGANYVVYLRNPPESSYVHTFGTYVVDRGYIQKGSQVDQAKDFTGISGYQELCININGQEECGFKEVSTSWAVDELSRQYAADQGSNTEITTSKNCVAGETSLILQPNLQATAEEALNPEIYKRGIIRVCSSDNPGKQVETNGKLDTTNSTYDRWKKVGYCDSESIGCWLDTNSVKDVLADAPGLLNQTLYDVNLNYVGEVDVITKDKTAEILEKGRALATDISGKWDKIAIGSSDAEIIDNLKAVSERGYMDKYGGMSNRANAFLILGEIYGGIAKNLYKQEIQKLKTTPESVESEEETQGTVPVDKQLTEEPVKIGTKVKDLDNVIWTKTSETQDGKYIWESSLGPYAWDNMPNPPLVLVEEGQTIPSALDIGEDWLNKSDLNIIFEVEDGTSNPNIYYRITNYNGGWEWSPDAKEWITVDNSPASSKNFVPDTDNVNLIRKLVDSDYNSGLKNIILTVLLFKDRYKGLVERISTGVKSIGSNPPSLIIHKEGFASREYNTDELTRLKTASIQDLFNIRIRETITGVFSTIKIDLLECYYSNQWNCVNKDNGDLILKGLKNRDYIEGIKFLAETLVNTDNPENSININGYSVTKSLKDSTESVMDKIVSNLKNEEIVKRKKQNIYLATNYNNPGITNLSAICAYNNNHWICSSTEEVYRNSLEDVLNNKDYIDGIKVLSENLARGNQAGVKTSYKIGVNGNEHPTDGKTADQIELELLEEIIVIKGSTTLSSTSAPSVVIATPDSTSSSASSESVSPATTITSTNVVESAATLSSASYWTDETNSNLFIFEISDARPSGLNDLGKVYYKFENSKWYWSQDNLNWFLCGNKEATGYSSLGYTNQLLVNKLSGYGYSNGLKSLLLIVIEANREINSQELSGEVQFIIQKGSSQSTYGKNKLEELVSIHSKI